ncbi:hypothetical protein PSCICP_07940 [Pseudomonas cichorii]|uniref:Uncharacterized protein n=1 Tax=Pseudomonas cichorii TaxID=36746 RepID=A0ABQ1DIZ3_PSECI|nr:hypothetical protein PSCICP_07940 [Pseudomonas cichorii]
MLLLSYSVDVWLGTLKHISDRCIHAVFDDFLAINAMANAHGHPLPKVQSVTDLFSLWRLSFFIVRSIAYDVVRI